VVVKLEVDEPGQRLAGPGRRCDRPHRCVGSFQAFALFRQEAPHREVGIELRRGDQGRRVESRTPPEPVRDDAAQLREAGRRFEPALVGQRRRMRWVLAA
jgi:hypothetical protein